MRYWFGGSPADWTMELDSTTRAMLAKGAVSLTFWSAPEGGVQYTDLLTEEGTATQVVYSGDGNTGPLGSIPRFQGPDQTIPVRLVYVQAAGSTYRYAMPSIDIGQALTTHEAAYDPHGAKAYTDTKFAQVSGGGGSVAGLGVILLDNYSGNDDAKFTAAYNAAKQATVKPTIVFPNRVVTLNGGPWEFFDGLKISGPVAANEREFNDTVQCKVILSKPMFKMPASGDDVRNMSFRNLEFFASTGSVDWMVRVTDMSNGPQMNDADFRDIAWNGFACVMQARHLRVSIERMYCNNGTDTQFYLAGSDNYYWTEGYSYLSGSVPANKYYVFFSHMSRSRVGAVYITPQLGTAIRIDNTYGGMVFDGVLFDSTGRTLSDACQGSALHIGGGEGYVIRNCWFFNNCVNPAATGRVDKGQIFIKAACKEIVIDACSFGGGGKQPIVTPAGTPAVYTQSGASNIRVSNPTAPYGGEKLLQQAGSGSIFCDDPTWTITTAA